ncbi:MAG: hypothetical protein ACPL3C_06140 [Pyrobaculum sp.]
MDCGRKHDVDKSAMPRHPPRHELERETVLEAAAIQDEPDAKQTAS